MTSEDDARSRSHVGWRGAHGCSTRAASTCTGPAIFRSGTQPGKQAWRTRAGWARYIYEAQRRSGDPSAEYHCSRPAVPGGDRHTGEIQVTTQVLGLKNLAGSRMRTLGGTSRPAPVRIADDRLLACLCPKNSIASCVDAGCPTTRTITAPTGEDSHRVPRA